MREPLFQRLLEPENFRLAFAKAARGKWDRKEVRNFAAALEPNLARLRREVGAGCVPVGDYRFFKIHDPKERRICAASFRERVLHHAILNVCEERFERGLIHDTFACRRGKGRQAALARAARFHQRGLHVLKMDIAKFFDSVPHRGLLRRLGERFRGEPRLHGLLAQIIASYATSPGRGLPIGSLTSQHAANFYLGYLDRFIKETLSVRRYVRYMDDFLLWDTDRGRLRARRARIAEFLRVELDLAPRDAGLIQPAEHGVNYLGFRLYPWGVKLSRRTKVRARRRVETLLRKFQAGRLDERGLGRRSGSLFAFLGEAESLDFRRALLRRGAFSDGG